MLLVIFESEDSKEEMKAELLETFQALYTLENAEETIPFLEQLEPFRVFFGSFDKLQMTNRRTILSLMDQVLQMGDFILPEELKSYCSLLFQRSPSTVLLVALHAIKAIQTQQMSKNNLRKAGIMTILLDYLHLPSEFPCEAEMKQNPEELKMCRQLLRGEDIATVIRIDARDPKEKLRETLYGFCLVMLRLLRALLVNNIENQQSFKEQ